MKLMACLCEFPFCQCDHRRHLKGWAAAIPLQLRERDRRWFERWLASPERWPCKGQERVPPQAVFRK